MMTTDITNNEQINVEILGGNIIWALKQIKHGKLKILFVRLKNSYGHLNKLFGA